MIRIFALCLALTAGAAHADAPRVVTDIAPIHSLVAQVMEGVGTPDLLVPPGTDAHHLALRPSDAQKLARAEVVVWIGPALTPWLSDPLATLAPDAATLTLLETPGWARRDLVDGHDHGGGDHAGHAIDPHAWLDPEVAMVWVRAIRDALVTTDPDNAVRYAANAETTLTGLLSLHTRLSSDLAGVPRGTWIAPHAAFGYFSDRYSLPSAAAISDGDDEAPGPAHLAKLRAVVVSGKVTCVLSETGGPTDYADLLTDGTDARLAAIDDTGMALEPGPALYTDLLGGIAATLMSCIQP
ncbi:zinc ABC transporter substrate-binding protein [Loktanella sp. DJP18]|uniref:zinc ABC transporter substrate-binding protein n=1 Tax=Loktanella sp. DJP18 TaxID=3409788 RepID=UPI003BB53451